MQVDKSQVLDFLRSRGDDTRLEEAERALPERIDVEQRRDLLARLGVDVEDLVAGGIGGILGRD